VAAVVQVAVAAAEPSGPEPLRSGQRRDTLRYVAGKVAASIGSLGVLADAYNTANTLPNIIYIMLVGGALNAVFIPQLVGLAPRAGREPGRLTGRRQPEPL